MNPRKKLRQAIKNKNMKAFKKAVSDGYMAIIGTEPILDTPNQINACITQLNERGWEVVATYDQNTNCGLHNYEFSVRRIKDEH